MMLGRVLPVRLPFSPSEDALIVRRQNKLARDIELINRSIRNNVLSRSEGVKRIRFKQSEIDELRKDTATLKEHLRVAYRLHLLQPNQ